MAAYSALVSLMNDLELIPNHPTHSFSFAQEQISSLLEIVHFFIDFLETYDYYAFGREAAEVLESRITTVAHIAHDVIESHIVDQIHAGSTLLGEKARTSYFLHDLQKAIEEMDFVKAKATQAKAKRRLREEEPTYSESDSSAPLISEKNVIVGFEDVAFRLMDMFIGGSPSQRVIPIVGMGGIGKTTLTKYVFMNSLIKHHFDVRLWATISHDYSVEHILRELLFGERNSATIGGNVGGLGEELHKKLWGKRYLVVLDDMWSEGAWYKLRMFLPDNSTGSCVIVTTRLSNLAALISSSPFEMNFLDEDKSWQLFCAKTFGEKQGCPIRLEEIGKKIVSRCKGLPLSIVVIGGHLRRSSMAIESWEKVANFMNPISSIGPDDQCLHIISLSYEQLPPCLKPCFLYMGIFEEDEQIDVSQLLEYWVAEGFLKPKENMSLEEIAEDYLKDLIDRNLINVAGKRRWNGKVAFCRIHDTVRELCLKIGKKEKFMLLVEDTTTTQGTQLSERRIVIPSGKKLNPNVTDALKSATLLRSLTYQQGRIDYEEMCVDLRLLRVSAYANNEVSNKDGRDFPASNIQQVNLRYLAFSSIKYLTTQTHYRPSSISLFWNMQTLIMKNDFVTISMPYEIWGMPQLRSLQFTRGCLPDPDPRERCIVLENLHTLVGVENLRLTEEVCIRMPNLKVLSMSYDYLPGDCEASSYYCPHNLGSFTKLESLECTLGHDPNWYGVGTNLTFPDSLEHLSLWNHYLRWEDLSMAKYLFRLRSLELNLVQGAEWDLVDLEFPSLKVLKIAYCLDLIHCNANRSHFPVLEMLCFSSVAKLREIPLDIGDIPTLRLIEVMDCSVSAAISAMRIVVEQETLGNEDIQVEIQFPDGIQIMRFKKMVQNEGLTTDNLHLYQSRQAWWLSIRGKMNLEYAKPDHRFTKDMFLHFKFDRYFKLTLVIITPLNRLYMNS